MITIYYKEEEDETFHTIDEPTAGCWIHVDSATTSDVMKLAKYIDCEYSDIHDCLDKYEIPRIERLNQNILIFTRHPSTQEVGLQTTTLTIILTKDYFITVCPHRSNLIDRFVSQRPKISTASTSKLLIHMLLRITQEFTIEIKKIRSNVLQKEKGINDVESEDITSLTISEENLNQYLSSLLPLRSVYQAISSGRYTFLHEEDQDLLEDLLNASMQSEELCTVILRTIRSLRDSYQIIFTNQLNKTIKLLTALTIILNIPTMVASLYGMNVDLPISKSPMAFIYIMIFIVVISILAFRMFQKRKWL
ncbi:MAG: magnesium transporter CorA family protein [Rhabdochlamydiaceae bacterium]|nr:magnesium transporter CorA family protein [Candidatus Amphrikana amoebophyrae]